MDSKRLILALAISFGILAIFTVLQEKFLPHPAPSPAQTVQQTQQVEGTKQAAIEAGAPGTAQSAPASGPRLAVDAPMLKGSIGLTGAVFDDVVLKQYHETIAKELAARADHGPPRRDGPVLRAVRLDRGRGRQGAG